MKTPVFVGSGTAIVTPFRDDFVDFGRLNLLIDEQIAAGTSALIVCGTTGEASTQTIPEHLLTIEYCVKHVAGRIPVIAGTGSNDTAHALQMSLAAEKSGADALLMVTPYYNKTNQQGLIRHYSYVAERVRIPIILYNVPTRTGMTFKAETYQTLSEIPNINGVKEASGDFSLIAKTRALCGDAFNIWSGNDDNTIPVLSLGGRGVISTSANIIPSVMADICRFWFAGEEDKSRELFFAYLGLMEALFIDVNPIPVKTAMNLMGKQVGHLRMPLCEMSGAGIETLKKAMAAVGLV